MDENQETLVILNGYLSEKSDLSSFLARDPFFLKYNKVELSVSDEYQSSDIINLGRQKQKEKQKEKGKPKETQTQTQTQTQIQTQTQKEKESSPFIGGKFESGYQIEGDPSWKQLYLQGLFEFVLSLPGRKVALGYSLGGRILLELLSLWDQKSLLKEDFFHQLIFVSTHPGLKEEGDRERRRVSDEQWAYLLETLDLSSFLERWNNQEVLSSSKPKSLEEVRRLGSSAHLKKVLLEFSLSSQDDMRSFLSSLPISQLWISGEKDQKYQDLHRELVSSYIQCISVQGAGHRVHQDQPARLSHFIQRILKKNA
jgi:hypothetical protein